MGSVILPAHRGGLEGSVTLPTSKSLTNRALIASAVAGGGTIVSPLDCDDTRVLAAALLDAGWPVEWNNEIEIGERSTPVDPARLDLADSGTGSRLILALLAASPGKSVVDGSDRLRERPMGPLVDALTDLGAELCSRDGFLPVEVDGAELGGGAVEVQPEISSQFVSALVMAAPLIHNGRHLVVSRPLPSAPYLDLPIDVMRAFGGELEVSDDRRRWRVSPVSLQKTRYEVEGDWSAAAFFLAAVAVVGGEVEIGPLDPASRQGDRAVVRILADAGLEVDWEGRRLIARGPVVAPISADLRHTPDLFPALAAAAACAPPGSRFSGLDHLKHKESDRLTVMKGNLERLGARMTVRGSEVEFEVTVDGGSQIPRLVVAAGDHRIAMAMAVAALGAGPLEIDEPASVTKSFPDFWNTWEGLLTGGGGEGPLG
jgi:3-phosphoshikimate 1-carboxyvinyltransferase